MPPGYLHGNLSLKWMSKRKEFQLTDGLWEDSLLPSETINNYSVKVESFLYFTCKWTNRKLQNFSQNLRSNIIFLYIPVICLSCFKTYWYMNYQCTITCLPVSDMYSIKTILGRNSVFILWKNLKDNPWEEIFVLWKQLYTRYKKKYVLLCKTILVFFCFFYYYSQGGHKLLKKMKIIEIRSL